MQVVEVVPGCMTTGAIEVAVGIKIPAEAVVEDGVELVVAESMRHHSPAIHHRSKRGFVPHLLLQSEQRVNS